MKAITGKFALVNQADSMNKWSQSRTRYVVEAGDTLSSIAMEELGDTRMSALIITINRGEIRFVQHGEHRLPVVDQGQTIWLPSEAEQITYARNYLLPRQSSQKIPQQTSAAAAAAPEPFTDKQRNPITHFLSNLKKAADKSEMSESLKPMRRPEPNPTWSFSEGDKSNEAAHGQAFTPNPTPASNVNPVRYPAPQGTAGSAPLQQISYQETQEPHLAMNSQYATTSHEAFKHHRELRTSPAVQLQFSTPQPAPVSDEWVSVRYKALSESCRLAASSLEPTRFNVAIEIRVNGAWHAVATYACENSQVERLVHRFDRTIERLPIELPVKSAYEMAMEDLQRNWKFYKDFYSASALS